MGTASPLFGANLLISNSSVPNAISAGDIVRGTSTEVPSTSTTITDNRKGSNHNLENFNYLYRDGHVALKNSLNGQRNVIDDSSLPNGDAVFNGNTLGANGNQTVNNAANVENIFLF
jgi:hypothetical protein